MCVTQGFVSHLMTNCCKFDFVGKKAIQEHIRVWTLKMT